jgi:hypothetical protein
MEQRQDEFLQLSGFARSALERPWEIKPQISVHEFPPIVRIWHYPSFGDFESWVILGSARTIARRVVWEKSRGTERMLHNPIEGA